MSSAVGKKMRFEIMKRDGFRCRYCGLTSLAVVLEVDHVIPRARGGTNAPENLVTACFDCNRGKRDGLLDETIAPDVDDPLALALEHAEQVREYLAAQSAVEAERRRVIEWVADQWRERVGADPPLVWYQRLRSITQAHSLELVLTAIDGVADASWKLGGNLERETKYFYGCLRRAAEREAERRGGL